MVGTWCCIVMAFYPQVGPFCIVMAYDVGSGRSVLSTCFSSSAGVWTLGSKGWAYIGVMTLRTSYLHHGSLSPRNILTESLNPRG